MASRRKGRRKLSPAEQWDLEHGVTPEQRRRANAAMTVVATGMIVLGVLLLAMVSVDVGMQAWPEPVPGEGEAQVTACQRKGLVIHRCQATVTRWTGPGPQVGQPIEIVSRRPLAGSAELERRTDGGRIIDKQGYSESVTYDVLVPRGDWIMPNWARVLFFIGYGVVWILLTGRVMRLVGLAFLRTKGTRPAS